ncbi:hypothetical protein [Candidatus Poriferisodalis sp.]|uniref:hypothetical protein n=1 Tax=Candidatus Poriferisodalis sp. TaxID=3101277 RepID=UPI003B020467
MTADPDVEWGRVRWVTDRSQAGDPGLQRGTVMRCLGCSSSQISGRAQSVAAASALRGACDGAIRARELGLGDCGDTAKIGFRRMLLWVCRPRGVAEAAEHGAQGPCEQDMIAAERAVTDASLVEIGDSVPQGNEDIEHIGESERRVLDERRCFKILQPEFAAVSGLVEPDRGDHTFVANGVEQISLVAQSGTLGTRRMLDQDSAAGSVVADCRTSEHIEKL